MKRKKSKYQELVDAFNDKIFQKKLINYKNGIEKEITEFIEEVKKQLQENQRILDVPEIRIKTESSFKDKISRKNYLKKWEIGKTKKENIVLISKQLEDLIQVRINCYFFDDEDSVYNLFKNYKFDKLSFDKNLTPKPLANRQHLNYKIEAIYDKKVCVEIQFKSLIDVLWSEVEHETGYKRKKYSSFDYTKKTITHKTFEMFKTADSQLNTLYNDSVSEYDIICSLFSFYSYEGVKIIINQIVLGKCYELFFYLTKNDEFTKKAIKKYVSSSILNKKYKKMKLSSNSSAKINSFKCKFEKEVKSVRFDQLYAIGKVLFDINSKDVFVNYISKCAISKKLFEHDEEDSIEFNKEGNDIIDVDDIDNIISDIKYELGE